MIRNDGSECRLREWNPRACSETRPRSVATSLARKPQRGASLEECERRSIPVWIAFSGPFFAVSISSRHRLLRAMLVKLGMMEPLGILTAKSTDQVAWTYIKLVA